MAKTQSQKLNGKLRNKLGEVKEIQQQIDAELMKENDPKLMKFAEALKNGFGFKYCDDELFTIFKCRELKYGRVEKHVVRNDKTLSAFFVTMTACEFVDEIKDALEDNAIKIVTKEEYVSKLKELVDNHIKYVDEE